MTRTYALSMVRPHETLGLPQPIGRRLPQGIWAWNIVFLAGTVVFALGYIVQVNASASKAFELRNEQAQVDTLKTQTMELQDNVVALDSMQALADRASQLGLKPVQQITYVNALPKAAVAIR